MTRTATGAESIESISNGGCLGDGSARTARTSRTARTAHGSIIDALDFSR